MGSKLFLGIDTSCYTTSVAVLCDGQMFQVKKMLDVKTGECGLRQSEGFFQHVKNLPVLFDEIKDQIDFNKYNDITVSVSARPRSVEGSYMPVFLAGQSFARVIADVLGAKYVETSHQDGHIMAAIHSCQRYDLFKKPFLTYHLSGGTTELLLVEKKDSVFECEMVGGTKDLPAGQFIDRVGVKMGLDFPCGKYVDELAVNHKGKMPKVKTCVNDGYINFSGEETRYSKLLATGADKEETAYCVMKCIAQSVQKSVEFAKEKYAVEDVLMVGGVSSSKFLRNEFSDMPGACFAEPQFSTDNAAGVCIIGTF